MRSGRLLLLLAGIAVPVALAALVLVAQIRSDATATPADKLPDLEQAPPYDLSGRTDGTEAEPRFFLGFASAATNVGDGPLIVLGRRPTVAQREMRLVQHVRRADGSTRIRPLRDVLSYVSSLTHSHWHLLGFMRYELRPAAGGKVLRDRKTGFCLGDRYRAPAVPGAALTGTFTDECGKNQPELLRLREGISVGFGDDYKPHLEGQELDVTTLPPGRYVLVHRVNPARRLLERDYRNNVASILFELSWPRGRKLPPRIDVIARCPGTATCR